MQDFSSNRMVVVSSDEQWEAPRVSFLTHLMSRLSRWWDRLAKVALISFLLLMSTGGYFIVLNIFFPGEKKAITAPHKEKLAAVRIITPAEITIPEEKPQTEKTKAPEKSKEKPSARPPITKGHPPQDPKPPALKSLSSGELVSLGEAHMGKGSFPSLIFSYPDPTTFIRQMYSLGAKTLISVNHRYYEINLLEGNSRPVPLTPLDFEGFSNSRRVIDDELWEPYKSQALQDLGLAFADCALLLVVPLNVELRWMGHQTHILQQLGINTSEVLTVEANFQTARLKLTRAHLKNGETKTIPDMTGA